MKNGTLTYTSSAGNNVILKLAPDGRLVGTYEGGRVSGTIEMSPTPQSGASRRGQ